jgi:heme/copper-type cytochrome/quinol oxidase subunit 2
MAELTTYLFPAVQALFCLIIAGAWLAGFIRQRNFGFLLLTLATLAEGLTSLIRQALTNYVIYHETHLSVAQRSSTIWMIAMTVLGIYIVFWLAITLGAILVVFHRSKYQTTAPAPPPVSG